MFNRNGNNNGAHEDAAAVASRNGNRHKPDAAIPAGHELLWDGLPPAVSQALGESLDDGAGRPSARGRGGRVLRLPRRPRRHRPGQPHLRLWRLGL